MSEKQELDLEPIYEIRRSKITWAIESIENFIQKRPTMGEDERMMWKSIVELLRDNKISLDWEQKFTQTVLSDETTMGILNVLSELVLKILPELEAKMEQVKKRKTKIRLEVEKNIKQELEQWFSDRETMKKAQPTYRV